MKAETSLDEQEVTVNIYPKLVDPYADVYSSIPHWTSRLRRLVKDNPDTLCLTELDGGIAVRVPADWIRISRPRTINMTEEQKRRQAERLRNAMLAKKEARDDGTA